MATTAISANDVASALDSMAETWENGGNELDAEFCTIAASMLRSLSREEQRVSALHAAAPDLLAVARDARHFLNGMVEIARMIGLTGTSDWDRLFGTNDGFGLIDKIDAVIAKAEGAQE